MMGQMIELIKHLAVDFSNPMTMTVYCGLYLQSMMAQMIELMKHLAADVDNPMTMTHHFDTTSNQWDR